MSEPVMKKQKSSVPDPYEMYLIQRNQLVQQMESHKTGAKLSLNEKEVEVMKKLAIILTDEIDTMRKTDNVHFAHSFFGGKKWMEQESKLFKVLKKFPKGSALHNHWIACGQAEWIVKDVLYMDGVYMCMEEYNSPKAMGGVFKKGVCRFWKNGAPKGWKALSELRKESGDAEAFDKKIFDELTFCLEDEIGTSENRWIKFQGIFDKYYFGLIFYKGLLKKFHNHVVKTFAEDNIQYAEFRSHFGKMVYDDDGNYLTAEEQAQIFVEMDKESVNQDWIGSKFVHESLRFHDTATIRDQMLLSMDLQTDFPDHVVAFDLVGEEDTGKSAFYYSKDVIECQQIAKEKKKNFKVMFHGGETNWPTENMIDLVLQDSVRIGHGFNLFRFPQLLEIVKQKDIALEYCPVSNQVLGLVRDQRNHPVATFIARDVPFTINSDDCGIFGYPGTTHDWYMVTTSNQLTLKQLKQLALNSIKYSRVSEEERQNLTKLWESKYEEWLDLMLQQ